MGALGLKLIISRYKIPLSAFSEAGLSKANIAQIKNHDIWPVKRARSELEEGIIKVLRKYGVKQSEMIGLFDREHDHKQTLKKKKPTIHLLKGGPKMLPEVVLKKAGLKKDPFTQEIEGVSDVFDAKPQMYVFQKMVDAAENQKLLGIFGEVGSGKTIIKNVFIEQLKSKRHFIISEPLINQKERLTPSSLVDGIIQDVLYGTYSIGMTGKLQSPRSLEAKNRFLRYHLAAKRRQGVKTVLIIDEAHDLTLQTIKSLKRLHELQDGFNKLLAIILIGQPELESLIKDYRVREVTARIDLVRMAPINGMFDDYLKWKIEKAGGELEAVFTTEAITDMKHRVSQATPLSINVLASHVIYTAFRMDTFPANAEIVDLAWKEMAN